jgi:hypothetical protein
MIWADMGSSLCRLGGHSKLFFGQPGLSEIDGGLQLCGKTELGTRTPPQLLLYIVHLRRRCKENLSAMTLTNGADRTVVQDRLE